MMMIHDGSLQGNTDWGQSMFDIAFAGRIEVLLDGTFEQFDDYSTIGSEGRGIMIGAALNYDVGNTDGNLAPANLIGGLIGLLGGGGAGDVSPDVLTWTVDISAEFPEYHGLTVMAAVIGKHAFDINDTAIAGPFGPGDIDQFAIQLQAGAFVIPDQLDVFMRYEYLALDDTAAFVNVGPAWVLLPTIDDDVHSLTFGGNYYLNGHASKFSFDLVVVLDAIAFGDTGAGVSAATDEQFVVRMQYQFLF